jgi:hypothetical protein
LPSCRFIFTKPSRLVLEAAAAASGAATTIATPGQAVRQPAGNTGAGSQRIQQLLQSN